MVDPRARLAGAAANWKDRLARLGQAMGEDAAAPSATASTRPTCAPDVLAKLIAERQGEFVGASDAAP